jgi:hypothetical protein
MAVGGGGGTCTSCNNGECWRHGPHTDLTTAVDNTVALKEPSAPVKEGDQVEVFAHVGPLAKAQEGNIVNRIAFGWCPRKLQRQRHKRGTGKSHLAVDDVVAYVAKLASRHQSAAAAVASSLWGRGRLAGRSSIRPFDSVARAILQDILEATVAEALAVPPHRRWKLHLRRN